MPSHEDRTPERSYTAGGAACSRNVRTRRRRVDRPGVGGIAPDGLRPRLRRVRPPRRRSGDRRWLDRFDGFDADALDPEEQIDRALVIATLGQRLALADWQEWKRSPEGYLETGVTELFLLGLRPEDELTAAAVDRLEGIGAVLDEAEKNLDPTLADRLIVERSLGECTANIGFARDEVARLATDPANQDRLAAAGEVAARAYERCA